MKKSYLIMAAIASVALASCSNEEFVGELDPGTGQGNPTVIRFGSLGKGLTRADLTGADAATALKNNFVFEGTKAVGSTTYSPVINDYQANYVTNTAHSTESNSDNWEYVGYKNVPGGVTANTGVPTFAAAQTGNNVITQSIKYWDYGTSQYDFAAYSLGKGVEGENSTTTYATATGIDMTKVIIGENEAANTDHTVYSLTGSADELKACYITDLITYYNKKAAENDEAANDFGKVVTFNFRSLATKIRLAFYETVPGYSVKDIKFYEKVDYSNNAFSTTTASSDVPMLLIADDSQALPAGKGTMKITFPTVGWSNRNETDYNKAHVSFTQTTATDAATKLDFGKFSNYPTTYEGVLTTGKYIGRTSNTATYADGYADGTTEQNPNTQGTYFTFLPNEAPTKDLMLRIKYTLVSTDGSGEEITVDNATAVIPKELAKWSPNYAYTYIFKISDMTNGSTGVNGNNEIQYGLTPITLNAVVVDSEDGIQETITTVSTPSITTYTQGKVVTENDEYLTNANIYIIVNNGTQNVELTTANAKLYTATATNSIQSISEASVDNALRYGTISGTNNEIHTVTDAKLGTLVVTDVTPADDTSDPATGIDWLVKKILADDSPTGNEIVLSTSQNQAAKFAPTATGTYVFQYQTKAPSTYTDETAAAHNATLPGSITAGNGYTFTSYGSADDSTPYGTGKARFVSTANGWTTVLVTINTPNNQYVTNAEDFVGKEFKVHATTPDENTFYQLYEANGAATGIYVKVATYTYVADDVNAYNARLTGHVSNGDPIPGEYQYKIIKVVQ